MAKRFQVVLSVLVAVSFVATARAGCEEIKTKIESQLQSKGINSYSIEIMPVVISPAPSNLNRPAVNLKIDLGKIVGSCDQGRKQLIYQRR